MTETKALVPFTEVKEMAVAAAKSGLFPGAKTPEAALALMLLAQAEGIHPMQAMRRYHVIEGQPSMRADAMLASFQAAGGRVTWRRTDDQACEAAFEAPTVGAPVVITWTLEDAKRAGVAGKGNWTKYPRQMLRARVISEGVRAVMPGVVVGIYTPEEVQDFDAAPRAARPAPAAPPPAPVAEDALYSPPPPPAPAPAADAVDLPALRKHLGEALTRAFPPKVDDLAGKAAAKATRAQFVVRCLGREVKAPEMTAADCERVLDALDAGEHLGFGEVA
jgi:hypothetical protein